MTFRKQIFALMCWTALFQLGCRSAEKKKFPLQETAPESALEKPPLPDEIEDTTQARVEVPVETLKKKPPKIQNAKKKRRGRFNFSSDEFIKESAFNPFEKKKDTIMRLRGHARVSSKNLRMAAPNIEIYGDDGRYAYAKGPVELTDIKQGTRITAAEALFLRGEEKAIMRKNVRLVSYVKNKKRGATRETITVVADEMERNFASAITLARGNVVASSGTGVLYAHAGEFIENEDLLKSSAEPRIFTENDVFLADAIRWNIRSKTADFSGHVRAYLNRPDGDGKVSPQSKEPKAISSAVRAEEGTLLQREDLPYGQKLTLHKHVVFERKSYSAFSDDAEIFGSGGEVMKASNHVVLINHEENSKSYGDFFDAVKATGYMSLTARKGARTRTVLHNKKNEPTVEILASSATRANTLAHPQARGNVQIIQFAPNKGANSTKMGGEWAEMRRAEKIIQLYGSPYVEGQMGRIGARDIILYYEEQRYEMLGIQPGAIDKMNKTEESHE